MNLNTTQALGVHEYFSVSQLLFASSISSSFWTEMRECLNVLFKQELP